MKMAIGLKTSLLLLLSSTDVQSARYAHDIVMATPKASVVLEINGLDHSVRVLEQTNVSVAIRPAEAQDLKIATAFVLECQLQQDNHLLTFNAYADSKYHLIPVDVVSYKPYNPGYITLRLDELYLTNNISAADFKTHRVFIDFYNRD